MPEIFNKVYLRHKQFWVRKNLIFIFGGLLWFAGALVIQHFAYNYIDNTAIVTPVGDLFLNNLPTINLDIFIVQGALLLTFIVVVLFLMDPKYLPFSLKTLALFLVIRSFFFSLTHLGANLHQITLDTHSIGFGLYDLLYNGKNDFFFSGHVGATFLFAFIFWKKVFWRYFFFTASFVFGVCMLFAHMHYSIDVFAAPFITYTIFTIATKIFKHDFALLNQNNPN